MGKTAPKRVLATRVHRTKGGMQVVEIKASVARTTAAALGFALLLASPLGHAAGGGYERPPVFTASKVLPASLLHSPYYAVEPRVTLDDYQYVFTVKTRWGVFTIKGTDLLRLRAREMAATVKIAKIDTSDTVVDSAGKAALKPLKTAKDLVTAPGKTIRDTFKGVGHMFSSVDAGMSATDPNREGLLASVTGGAKARRQLAYQFGVDPHTSFPPLSDQLTRVATASAVGQTGSQVGFAFVTGGAGIAISAGSTSETLREYLRDKTAAELEQTGRTILAQLGVSQAEMDGFYKNPHLSPTDKAIIVAALKLVHAKDSGAFIVGASKADSIQMGFFYRRQAELIVGFDQHVAHIRSFVRLGGAPMLETTKGTASVLPVDYLYWSPPIEALAANANREHKGGGQFWLTGRASRLATAKLAGLGWRVHQKALKVLTPDDTKGATQER